MNTQILLKMKKIGEHDLILKARLIQLTKNRETRLGSRIKRILIRVLRRETLVQQVLNQVLKYSKLDRIRPKTPLDKILTKIVKELKKTSRGTQEEACMMMMVSTFIKMVRLWIHMATTLTKKVMMNMAATMTKTTYIAGRLKIARMQTTETKHEEEDRSIISSQAKSISRLAKSLTKLKISIAKMSLMKTTISRLVPITTTNRGPNNTTETRLEEISTNNKRVGDSKIHVTLEKNLINKAQLVLNKMKDSKQSLLNFKNQKKIYLEANTPMALTKYPELSPIIKLSTMNRTKEDKNTKIGKLIDTKCLGDQREVTTKAEGHPGVTEVREEDFKEQMGFLSGIEIKVTVHLAACKIMKDQFSTRIENSSNLVKSKRLNNLRSNL